ncbi:MAG: histidinol dehydrogenase [Tissierellia bacterium]|nr:histidinol dehydrogenase [Bacillota bacterium]NLL22245.1 histidinol dehydrogenase [Tissierellia bacterium]
MITVLKASEYSFDRRYIAEKDEKVEETVARIIEEVKQHGDEALLELTERFDGVRPSLTVTGEEIESAYKSCDPLFLSGLEKAAANIRRFHKEQLYTGFEIREEGIVLGQRVLPLQRVGIYVPGGTASYPSTVLMNAIPAVLAGVKEIAMVSPPGKDAKIAPGVLAAAKLAGVSEIYRCGGVQAIAALAYGTQTIEPVDKIVGPGNIFVATAKKQVFGLVDIDMVAGPSEILVIADESARADFVAADLLSQAEHDVLARPMLICFSEEFSEKVTQELKAQLALLERKEIAGRSLREHGVIMIADTMEEAVKACNALAPEHLVLAVQNPVEWLPLVKHAGSIFLGHYSPEPLGDYWAGPNHTLPTMGTARFASPLSVEDFVKRSSYIQYSKQALENVSEDIRRLAEYEGLEAHARAVDIRRKR